MTPTGTSRPVLRPRLSVSYPRHDSQNRLGDRRERRTLGSKQSQKRGPRNHLGVQRMSVRGQLDGDRRLDLVKRDLVALNDWFGCGA